MVFFLFAVFGVRCVLSAVWVCAVCWLVRVGCCVMCAVRCVLVVVCCVVSDVCCLLCDV